MSTSEEGLKLATSTVEAATKAGSYISRVFGSIPENFLNWIIGDKLENTLCESRNEFIDIFNQSLEKKGLTERYRPVAPKYAVPIFLNASIEKDKKLQEIWCKLLINCSDPDFDEKRIRYVFIEIIKNLTSLDAQVLKYIYDNTPDKSKIDKINQLSDPYQCRDECRVYTRKIIEGIHALDSDIILSLYNLKRAQCVWNNDIFYKAPEKNIVTFMPNHDGSFTLTPLGSAFVEACLK